MFIICPIHATWVTHLIFGLLALVLFGEYEYGSSAQLFITTITTAAAAALASPPPPPTTTATL